MISRFLVYLVVRGIKCEIRIWGKKVMSLVFKMLFFRVVGILRSRCLMDSLVRVWS